MVFVLSIILILGALAAVFYVGSLWLQGTIYSEPAAGLAWRAPVAAAVLTAYFVCFHFIGRTSGPFNTLFSFSARQSKQFSEFRSVLENNVSRVYRLDPRDGTYKDADGKPWKRATADAKVEKIIVVESDDHGNDNDVVFRAELTSSSAHNFKDQNDARYVEEGGGREMRERFIGQVSTFRFWILVGNVLLNLVHLALWFACLWLLLRFQWTHALLGAVVFWLVITLLLLPSIRG
jgi:hypothetical protein